MPFWSATDVTDPKRQHRWLVEMGVEGLSEVITYVAKKVSKPKMSVNAAEHKFLNHTFYYPGNVSYEEVSLTLVDPTNPQATLLLYQLLQDSGYTRPDLITDDVGANTFMASTMGKRLSVSKMGGCSILMLNGLGYIVEKTILKNAWISSVDFGGELSYESDGLMEITLGIRFDYIILEKGEGADMAE